MHPHGLGNATGDRRERIIGNQSTKLVRLIAIEKLVKAVEPFGEMGKARGDRVELDLPQPQPGIFRNCKEIVPRNQQPPRLGCFPDSETKQQLEKVIVPGRRT